mmetsp:Transcript_89960/g.178779  ORF Transcript_89960/g.178779 Transcript_89960/m.178779 type:complete len:198 (+) Transcript_89960:632-1225(+)
MTFVLFAVNRRSRSNSCHELHNLLREEAIVRRNAPATFCALTFVTATPAPLVEAATSAPFVEAATPTFLVEVVTDDSVVVEVVVVQVPLHDQSAVVVVEVAEVVVGHMVEPHFWFSADDKQPFPERVRCCAPPPHVTEQVPQADQVPQHGTALQLWLSDVDEQLAPTRVRSCVPLPQVTEQVPQDVQLPQQTAMLQF